MNRIITTEITGLVLLLIIGVSFGILSLKREVKSKFHHSSSRISNHRTNYKLFYLFKIWW